MNVHSSKDRNQNKDDFAAQRNETDVNITAGSEILEVFRRFEPIICYTKGEKFFPIAVERYIDQCSLWVKKPDQPAEILVPEGDLNIDKLVSIHTEGQGNIYFLKLIEPLDIVGLAKYSIDQTLKSLKKGEKPDSFRPGRDRLARVGYGSRFVDALFSLSLVWRGHIPGETATAAILSSQRMQKNYLKHTYYGRLIQQNGWVILQYWYFYAFNDWRSSYFGANDHEGDWEMVCIYCSEGGEEKPSKMVHQDNLVNRLVPQWVAYASHDFSGDDLRRRWDDPEVEKKGDHPIVYAGGGSHASYYSRGEYMPEIELPFLLPLVKLVERIKGLWVNFLRQAGSNARKPEFNIFRIPFIDYARGDGVVIGVGQSDTWEVSIIDENTSWAFDYHGLWGLYVQDSIAGENAPSGPVYERNGAFRKSWYDPLGWAGLDKVPPPNQNIHYIDEQISILKHNQTQLSSEIEQKSAELNRLGIESSDFIDHFSQPEINHQIKNDILTLSKEISNLRNLFAQNRARVNALKRYRLETIKGEKGSMRAHIHRPLTATSGTEFKLGIFAEIFAALSVGLLLVAIVLIFIFARQYLLIAIAALVGIVFFLEASFRKQLKQLINSLSIGFAIASALVILYEFFWQIALVGVLSAGLFIIWENIRELSR